MLQTAIISAADKTLQDTSDHFLVLGENHNWCFLEDKNPWFLSITDYSGHVIMQSEALAPKLGVKMFGYEYGSKEDLLFGITGTIEELLELHEHYRLNKNLAYAVLEGIKAVNELYITISDAEDSTAVIGPIEDLVKAYSASEEVFIKQADSKVAQSQAAINSAKITRLEKELKQARELQKLLKKLR